MNSVLKAELMRPAGLWGGPAAWAVNTQLGQVLSSVDCGASLSPLAVTSGLSTVVALATACLSWRGLRSTMAPTAGVPSDTDRFIGRMGTLGGLLFGFALALQGCASLILSPCVS